jgi:hypothetical protein
MRIAVDLVTSYLLPIPRKIDGVFRSVVDHINSRKEKWRPMQLEGLRFRQPRPDG